VNKNQINMKKNQNIIPKELRQGRKPGIIRRVIKRNRRLHRFLYKLLRCNRYVWILQNFWRDTDKLFNCISIETCAICNRKCPYCPISKDPRSQVMMSNELFDKIIKELKELNYRGDVILSNFGEPLLDKRLATFIRIIKRELGCKVIFFTNGDFLTKEKFDELIAAGADDIEISQHDPEPSDVLKKLFSQLSSSDLKHVSFKIVKEDTLTLTDYGGLIDVESLHPFSCNPYRIIVRADGNVPLCCGDYYNEVNFGNVNQKKLIDIWNSPFYRKIRNELKRGIFNFEICKRCRGILPPKKYGT
jgi:radical SAM protein with 4Fe4S-binding SPASM domain